MASQRVGVIGGGQLAWMMAQEARKLGIELIVQTPSPDDPAVSLASDVILAPIADVSATERLSQLCDVITFENEFIDLDALQVLAQNGVCFRPSLNTLYPLLDKYDQRCFLKAIGLPVPHFSKLSPDTKFPVEDVISLGFTFPLVVKARRHGYDGYGTFIFRSGVELENLYKSSKNPSLIVEEYIPFAQELAVIAARSLTGEIVIYPVVETQQENQVCHRVIVPAEISPQIGSQIEEMTKYLLEELQAVGVFGIELFLGEQGQILFNEIAPRTHNSGHYTLDGAVTSQFAMQLQAVTGLPLGSAALKSSGVAMVNLLGYEYSHDDYRAKREQISAIGGTYLHWYGKTESRPGRKLGHVTIMTDKGWSQESSHQAREKLLQVVKQVESIWYCKV